MSKHIAILLIGPTGSGKTPLGELLESKGLWGRRCVHFDFGENLRRVPCPHAKRVGMSCCSDMLTPSGREHGAPFTSDELNVVAHSLETGALLEDEHFPIARKILLGFLNERNVVGDDLIVLNGLPRHIGQAGDIDAIVDIKAVIYLCCSPEVVYKRVHTDAGGDRAERIDDDIESVKRKLGIFVKRTAPLLEHYRQRGAKIETVDIKATTAAIDIWEMLNRP